jgi:hypothetical protein
MLSAHDSTDSLWINLKRNRDDKLKEYNTVSGTLSYPGVNGIVSNTVDSLLGGKYILPFKTHTNRSGADVNAYTVLYPEKLTFLGDQQGYWEGAVIPDTDILNTIVSIQDIIELDTTTVKDTIFQDPMVSILPRRAVDLAFEPQNILNEKASEQIVYDAIMFASLAHATEALDTANAGIAVMGRRKHTIKCDETVNLLATGGATYAWSAVNPKHSSLITKTDDSTYTFTPSSKFIGDTFIYRVIANVVINVENKIYARKDTLFLTLNVEPITMPFGDDVAIFAGDSVKLNGSGNSSTPDFRYTWSPTNGLNGTHLESPTASPESTTVYNVTFDDGHCFVTGAVTVAIRPPQVTNALITRAVTRDTNGNGYLDAVEIYFNAPVDLPTITSLFAVTHGTVNFTPAGMIEKPGIEDSVLILSLREQKAGELQTGWQLQLSAGEIIIFKNSHDKFIAKWDRIVTEDGAGPVIDRAVFFPGYGDLASDSLEVTLSEPLSRFSFTNESSVESFCLYNKNAQQVRNAFASATYIDFDGEKKIKVRVGIRTEGKTKIIPNSDSLQFFQGSGIYRITDISGNPAPDSSIARKTRIEYNGVNRVILNVLNNPIIVGRNKLDPDILRSYNHVIPPNSVGGGIFNIKTLLPLKETEGNYGEARIYDAVGNVIADRLPIRLGVQTLDYAIYWDGTNKTGRYVGQGSYQLRIRVVDIHGTTMRGKTLIGVYR